LIVAALYADENFPLPVVVLLRAAGHDVLTAREDGRADLKIPDPDVLAHATSLGRAVLTHNRSDFFRLHRTSTAHAGIVACTEDLDFAALSQRIHVAIQGTADHAGQLIRITRPNPPPVP
jgi:Domain of unknown function (DUF5615)